MIPALAAGALGWGAVGDSSQEDSSPTLVSTSQDGTESPSVSATSSQNASASSSTSDSTTPSADPSPATTSATASPSGSTGSDINLPFGTRCSVSSRLVPACGAYWGIYSRRYGGGDTYVSARTWEKATGRRFDIILKYFDFSNRVGPGRFPDTSMAKLGKERILLFDWETKIYSSGAMLRWANVASGKYDSSVIIPQAKRIKAYGKTVMLGLDHEMDLTYASHGTPAEYKAMYRHVRSVFAAQGVRNVVWTWVTSGYLGEGNDKRILSLYPGDSQVDWIGYDPYNFNSCHDSAWKTFTATVSRFYDWTASHGLGNKPLIIQEYGTHYDGNSSQAVKWYRDIPSVLASRRRIKAVVRWDSDTSCTLRIDSGPGVLAAFTAAGRSVSRP
jgi:hypothetical protein